MRKYTRGRPLALGLCWRVVAALAVAGAAPAITGPTTTGRRELHEFVAVIRPVPGDRGRAVVPDRGERLTGAASTRRAIRSSGSRRRRRSGGTIELAARSTRRGTTSRPSSMKGGEHAKVYYYDDCRGSTTPTRADDADRHERRSRSAPTISHVDFCFDPKRRRRRERGGRDRHARPAQWTIWKKVYRWDVDEVGRQRPQLNLPAGGTGIVHLEGRRHADARRRGTTW